MSDLITVPCGNCGGPVTDTEGRIQQRRLQNAGGLVYCQHCKAYGGLTKAKCTDCGREFSFRAAAAVLGQNFRPAPRRCPPCRDKREAAKSMRCRWCGAVAIYRAGDVIRGTEIGSCAKPACKSALVGLITTGAARWADLTAAQVGPETAGFLDPWMEMGHKAVTYQKREA